ncbi:helix-turn-helix domain-containing protein [Streptomyces hirsutus]|uniref:helix-turn-helix domain-containing protein n=1 Tax=Streptomyces hirsutus TaxID=35620 RepID=UPI0033DB9287
MVSHVEQQITARIAAVRARREQQAADRVARVEQRAHGVATRHAAKLRRLTEQDRVALEQCGGKIEQPPRGGCRMTGRARDHRVSTPIVTSDDTSAAGYQIRSNDPGDEGHVVVPRALAPTVFNAVVLYLDNRVRSSRGAITPDARALLRELHRAAEGAPEHSSDNGTPSPSIATVATGSEVSVMEAAALLGCTPDYARRLARSGAFQARRIGARTWAIDRTSLDTYRHGGTAA